LSSRRDVNNKLHSH